MIDVVPSDPARTHLQAIRAATKASENELAAAAGVAPATIYAILRGARRNVASATERRLLAITPEVLNHEAKRREEIAAEIERLERGEAACADCGVSHDRATRLCVIRRMLPCRPGEIAEAYGCFYGCYQERGVRWANSAGYARLHRDLLALGAVREHYDWWRLPCP